ncbi:protein of unknown function UPF0153 (plasmid) [Rhodoferax ferrireducens T118]|uniref:Zinc/iron-chelating domain-containing protein n=1 Tax=Albidiferax ferrireducens (strain ATCC BAA-621 / DSM 15236 / T118) TaxID=338969 RepID=Q21QC1_ALBFT|nr:YkgJ family cysteine cluster protein [Rhodoferax ferrireducens]ABD72024.1 protein of unknown function UPF0153 [Rhodoferax ferrireducens T118]
MNIADINPEVLRHLADRKENNDWHARHQRIDAAMTPEWKAKMDQGLRGVMVEASSKRSKLAKLYSLLDMTNELKAPEAACKEGCDYCCHMQVEIAGIEAKRIAEFTGRKAVELRQGRHTTPAHQLGKQETPCPFLTNKRCTIYEIRPFVCRDLLVLDKDAMACSFENMSLSLGDDPQSLPVPQISARPVGHAFAALTYGTDAFADIRQFFP